MLLRSSIHTRAAASGSRLTPTDSSCLFFEAIHSDLKLKPRRHKKEHAETLYLQVIINVIIIILKIILTRKIRYIVSSSTPPSQEVSWPFTTLPC
jgi:hypothetical protein